MARRLLAIVVLLIVALVAIRLVVGAVLGLVHVVEICGSRSWPRSWSRTFWAWRTLSGARKPRTVKESGSRDVQAGPAVDPIEVEMRKITEELRKQGR